MNCIFCDIINKTSLGDIIYENDKILVIKDLYPKRQFHWLIIPKVHKSFYTDLNQEEVIECFQTIKNISERFNLKEFSLEINQGSSSGQMIFHVHLHFMAGEKNI